MFLSRRPGDIAPAYSFDAKSVLRGAELLGKHLGMFTEKHEHTGKDGAPIEVSMDEAARRIAFMLSAATNK
jgi:phage terminase small subunit